MKVYLSQYLLPISSDPIENGGIVVEQDRIREVGPAEELIKKYPKAEKINFEQKALLPGLVNAHCHLELQNAPSFESTGDGEFLGQPNFVRWLIRASKHQDSLKPNEKRASIQTGLQIMKDAGITTVADHTTYEGALACYRDSGLRVVAYPEVMNLNRKLTQDRFESALGLVDEILAADNPKLRVGLAPYAPYTLSKNLLKIFYQHLKQLGVPVQIHASESFSEMEFFYDSKGDIAHTLFPHIGWGDNLPPPHQKTPIQYLHSIEFLQAKPALVGCVHLGPTDLSLIAHSGSSIVYCPRSNQALQLGRSPVRKMLSNKIPVGLGSDHLFSEDSLLIWEEMRAALEYNQGTDALTPEEVLKMATLGGACNLGLEKQIGSLDKGKLADFIVVKTPKETTLSRLAEDLIQKTRRDDISQRFVGGLEVSASTSFNI